MKIPLPGFAFPATSGILNIFTASFPIWTVITERIMTKDFLNIMIKSLLSCLRETVIMSKENRKAY